MYITVTSGKQDPCDFISNFVDSIDIHDGYEVALTGIYHGPLFNIDEEHNKFTLKKGKQVVNYVIPPGYYQSTAHLVLAMYDSLVDRLKDTTGLVKLKPGYCHKKFGVCTLIINDPGVKFLNNWDRDGQTGLLQHFGYYLTAEFNSLDVAHEHLGSSTEPTFIYSNIVSNSVVDNHESRLLACAPLKTVKGFCYHEFTNPSYHPLRVNSFTDISFQMRNVDGKLIQIQYMESTNKFKEEFIIKYPTIMILHVRKRSIG